MLCGYVESSCYVNELIAAIRELQRQPQNDPDYVLINTGALKRIYAPKQATDQVSIHEEHWQKVLGVGVFDVSTDIVFRRPRHLAWLEIANVPVQPNTPIWILHRDGTRRWAEYWIHGMEDNFISWQPAPSAPKPPVDEAELGKLEAKAQMPFVFNGTPLGMARDAGFDFGWQARGDYERSKGKS